MPSNLGAKGKLAALALVVALAGIAFAPLVASSASGGTHIGYRDEFVSNSATLPVNYVVVRGPSDAQNDWQVAGGTLQAINVAGTAVRLADPNLPIDLVGNRLLALCFNPENTINSLFYSGFTQNIANIVEVGMGDGVTDLTIHLNLPAQVLQLVDQAGNVIDQVPLPINVPFNVATCLNIAVDELTGEVRVILGQALDAIGNVVNGVHAAPLHAAGPVPSGTVIFAQPAGNTGRIMFSHLWVMATPDLPVQVQTYAGPGNGQITLGWHAPAQDGGRYVREYNVFRGTTPGNLQFLDTVPAFDTQYIDTPYTGIVPSSQKFYYAISAVNDVGPGPVTGAVCMVPYPLGLLPLDGTGVGCGDHGVVANPLLSKVLG
ncbi:MAG: hypothetical protein LC624_09395 [Halobacteriales archaeon]|nr:hypothetical protein [Halobacteriales archaeon]